jgi:C4-dicarboxylate-specific signal transduction histidine kinase
LAERPGTPLGVTAQPHPLSVAQSSEQRYQTLFHFVPVALIQFDRTELAGVFENLKSQGVQDLMGYIEDHPGFIEYALNSIQVVEVNRRTIELFAARDAAQLLGPVRRFWSEAVDIFQRSMAARFAGAASFEAEFTIRTLDDRLVNVWYVTDFPEALQNHALGLACLVDISDRVKAQEMLVRLQAEFAHAGRVSMLGELTASIAHEINQPLGAIMTNSETALRWLDRPEPDLDELRALATRAIADARRAGDIISRVRAMAERSEPERALVSLNGIVRDVMVFLEPELRRHGVEAVLDLAAGLPDIVADRIQLQQVFANLAINAVQAMSSRAERRLTIRTMLTDQMTLCAEVEDTGPGIPDDHSGRLFQSFFTTKEGGLGIGLAICRSIIEAHGGRIEAANRGGGQGAVFCFTLPVVTPASD